MKCKYCGYALPKNSAVCPHCKRMLTKEQLEERKEMNGINNPYVQRLEKISYDMYKNKIEKNENHISITPYVVILLIVLFVILFAMFL